MLGAIDRENDFIHVKGDFTYNDLFPLLATIHAATEKYGFSDLTLDFKDCTSAFPPEMIALCSQIIEKRENGTYIHLNMPSDEKLKRLFEKANWAYLLDPRRYEPVANNFFNTHIPATQYTKSTEQFTIVNKIVDNILGAIPHMQREDFSAFEWAINEITDNVLTHSESIIGGIVALSLSHEKKKVQYMVSDAGIGIPETLRSGDSYKGITDVEALQLAIKEGVTRDKNIGQGNGLFGSYEISNQCNGTFRLRSGYADLLYSKKRELKISQQKVPYNGTFVHGEIDFSIPGLLADALSFNSDKHMPSHDFIDYKYQPEADGTIAFILKDEADSFGSRPAGTPIRNKLKALCEISDYKKIRIDFLGVPILSSSFADEAFGKLFKEIGPLTFMQKIEFINVHSTCKNLIDKAITQRVKGN